MKKGIVKDPWRYSGTPSSRPAEEQNRGEQKKKSADYVPNTGDNDDYSQYNSYTVKYPNYGGITVKGVSRREMIGGAILQFCIDNQKDIDNTLVEYGLLLVRLKPGKMSVPFFITRSDGWTLTVPDAETRKQGLFQLIQCLLALDEHPKMKAAMRKFGITPHRI